MSTAELIQKAQKAKTNKFVLILEQFLERYNLSTKSTPEQLNKHASELNALLPDWKSCKCVKKALVRGTEKRSAFSKKQKEVFMPDQGNMIYSVRKRAQEVAKSEDKWNIFINTLDLGSKGSKDGVIDDKEMVASSSNQSRFHKYLAEYEANPELIDRYAKDSKTTTASNKIQQKWTEKRLANPGRTPEHFTFEKVLRRLQNIDTSKIPSMQDLADMIVMLSMRLAEVSSLQIINYKPDSEDLPAWYKDDYSWYCTGCRKQRDKPMPMHLLSMEKDPECARELLTWIQDAIKAGKLHDPVYTETGKRNNVPFAKFIKSLKTNQDEDEITPKLLRKIGAKHASMVHAGPNPTSQHLNNLSEIALRHKINRLDAGKNYALGDPKSKKEPNLNQRQPVPPNKCESRSTRNTGHTLKANSVDKSICNERRNFKIARLSRHKTNGKKVNSNLHYDHSSWKWKIILPRKSTSILVISVWCRGCFNLRTSFLFTCAHLSSYSQSIFFSFNLTILMNIIALMPATEAYEVLLRNWGGEESRTCCVWQEDSQHNFITYIPPSVPHKNEDYYCFDCATFDAYWVDMGILDGFAKSNQGGDSGYTKNTCFHVHGRKFDASLYEAPYDECEKIRDSK
ncbi:hypothetical protein GLOIN_2v1846791 [Rhizophagus clarus]|uniref:Uncharacterized protein n=1 Tax=Rhizophagus clarus TaxID=94130 RepID=A0A8H3LVJ7_9GLOM|nr:hypothetical protein GLOIN_2v1846791 [Rhizophagus clarus]